MPKTASSITALRGKNSRRARTNHRGAAHHHRHRGGHQPPGAGATDGYTTASTSNRLTAITGPRATSYTYDNAGNTLSGEGTAYTYNVFGRLATATKAGTTTYAINALGQRVHKQVGSGPPHWFAYGPGGQLLSEHAGSWTHYVRLPDGTPIARIKGSTLLMLHTDHLGRPEIATDSAKAVVWRASNYAFDRTVTLDSIGGLNLGFPGQYYDAETGNWYNHFRTYNPRTGRYVESDPIGLGGGLNTYAYVSGNPVNEVDPLGLISTGSELADCRLNAVANGLAQVTPYLGAFLGLSGQSVEVFNSTNPTIVQTGQNLFDVASGALSTAADLSQTRGADALAERYREAQFRSLNNGNRAYRRDLRKANEAIWQGSKSGLKSLGKILSRAGGLAAVAGTYEDLKQCGCNGN